MSDDANLPPHVDPNQFVWVLSDSQFLYLPTRTLIKYDTVKRRLGGESTHLVERQRVCSNLFWSPGMDMILKNKAVIGEALTDFPGNSLFNMYVPPPVINGDPALAKFWLDLGEYVWGEDLDEILDYLAFKVQHPEIKINHALVLGSYDQGIGKDSFLKPVKTAIGPWNFGNVTAGLAREWDSRGFNVPILRRVLTQISEVHDLGDDRFGWYEKTKDWCAAPPDMLTVADKNVKAHAIANVVDMIFTTNHKADGLYLPPTDRRHFVGWSPRTRADFEDGGEMADYFGEADFGVTYWQSYWNLMTDQRYDLHAAAYLLSRDVSHYDPGRPPRRTAAWQEIVDANRDPHSNDLTEIIDDVLIDDFGGRPDAVTISMIARACGQANQGELAAFFHDAKNARKWTKRLEDAGYVTVSNADTKDGRWRFAGKRHLIYARRELPPGARLDAAHRLMAGTTEDTEAAEEFAHD